MRGTDERRGLVEHLLDALKLWGVPPRDLVIEVTETAIIADLEPGAAQKLCDDYKARKLFCEVKKPTDFAPPFSGFWR